MTSKPLLTIICPVFNEDKVIELFFHRILPEIKKIEIDYRVNLLFLNNASTDQTYEVIDKLRQSYDFIYIATLSRNVGYQRSLECGLKIAKGDLIAFIDVDCEDPPELLKTFLNYHQKGYDLVYGERVDREESNSLKAMRKLFYHVVRLFADEEIILYMAEFSLFTAEVRDAALLEQNSFPFIRSSLARVGFRRIGIPYKRQKRIAGETHYNFVGMTVFAIAGILSSSTLPLRLPLYSFPVFILLNGILGYWFLKEHSITLLMSMFFICIFYFGASLSFIALYVARTYKNGLGRPNFFIHSKYSALEP